MPQERMPGQVKIAAVCASLPLLLWTVVTIAMASLTYSSVLLTTTLLPLFTSALNLVLVVRMKRQDRRTLTRGVLYFASTSAIALVLCAIVFWTTFVHSNLEFALLQRVADAAPSLPWGVSTGEPFLWFATLVAFYVICGYGMHRQLCHPEAATWFTGTEVASVEESIAFLSRSPAFASLLWHCPCGATNLDTAARCRTCDAPPITECDA
jgi:amino acid transporter